MLLQFPGARAGYNQRVMDVLKMLDDLRAERTAIEEAILVLERLAIGGKRRGRPPAWITRAQDDGPVVRRRGRPPGSKNKPKAPETNGE